MFCDELAVPQGEYSLLCHIFITSLGFFRTLNRLVMSLEISEDVLTFHLKDSYNGQSSFRFFSIFFFSASSFTFLECMASFLP